jgi:hypothetical protein
MWVPITYVVGPVVTSLLCIKFGEGGWTKLDRICLIGVGIGLISWVIYRSPDLTLWINIGVDFLGAIPTIYKSYQQPEGEDSLAWLLFSIANALNLLVAISEIYSQPIRGTWQMVIYPMYVFLMSAVIYLLLQQGQKKRRKVNLN